MGYDCINRATGLSHKDFFASVWGKNHEILAHHTEGGVFYAATLCHPTGETSAVAVPFHWDKQGRFWYRELEETMHPSRYDCPNKILDLLSPTVWRYAVEWRNECRKRNAQKATARKAMRGGKLFKVKIPFRFSGYGNVYYFKREKGNRFIACYENGCELFYTKMTLADIIQHEPIILGEGMKKYTVDFSFICDVTLSNNNVKEAKKAINAISIAELFEDIEYTAKLQDISSVDGKEHQNFTDI